MTRSVTARICKFHLLVVLVFIYILLLPCIYSFSAWRRMRRKRRGWVRTRIPLASSEREHYLRLRNSPHKLPEIRKRVLTLPLEDTTNAKIPRRKLKRKVQGTNLQLQSMLLTKLPPELRGMIWEESLGGEVLHVVRMHKRLGHTPCDQKRRLSMTDDSVCCRQYYWTPGGDHYGSFPDTAKPRKLLGLVKTCRMVYSESIDILYAQNTFAFRDLDAVLDLQTTILPARLQSITALQINWNWDNPVSSTRYNNMMYKPYNMETWEQVWAIIVSMKSLKVLKLDLKDTLRNVDADRETMILAPMKKVTHLSHFDVRLGWQENDGVDLSNLPFKIVRPLPNLDSP